MDMTQKTKYAENSPYDREKLEFYTVKGAIGCATVNDSDMVLQELEKYAERRRIEIRSTSSAVSVSGTCYYVANDGDDSNDGKSPECPWKTLEKVSDAELCPGDGVFFKRGDLFRGEVVTKAGVTYSAYGEGEKPKIYGSDKNYAGIGFWKKTDKENVYISAEPIELDVGLIVFDDGAEWGEKMTYGIKNYEWCGGKDFEGELVKDLQFHHNRDDKHVYLYSVKDPNGRGKSCEMGVLRAGFGGDGNGVTIDNICLKYVGAHGIAYANTERLTVQNCEIGWIGGSIQSFQPRVVRFGNGVEIYVSCKDFAVKNCYIYQCYDCGVTHQYFGNKSEFVRMENISYSDNLIEHCTYAIEWVNSQAEENGIMKNVEFSHNLLLYSGEGWGCQRPFKWDSPLKGWQHTNRGENFVIYDNVATARDDRTHLVVLGCAKEEYVPALVGNLFIGVVGNPFGKYGLMDSTPYTYGEDTPSLPGLEDNDFVFIKK